MRIHTALTGAALAGALLVGVASTAAQASVQEEFLLGWTSRDSPKGDTGLLRCTPPQPLPASWRYAMGEPQMACEPWEYSSGVATAERYKTRAALAVSATPATCQSRALVRV